MCLVIWILFEELVIIDVSKNNLTEAVKVRDIGKLGVYDSI